MIKHYLVTALRQIVRSKLFSAINIVGFMFSITASLFIYLWIVDELTFEHFHKDYDRTYRVTTSWKMKDGSIKPSPKSYVPVSKVLTRDFPQVESSTFYYAGNSGERKVTLQLGENKVQVGEISVDTTFFDFFSFPLIEGDPSGLGFDEKIVISRDLAKKLFGKESAVGKRVQMPSLYKRGNEPEPDYIIIAVVDVPKKSHIQFDIAKSFYQGAGRGMSLASFYDGWRSAAVSVYMKAKKNVEFSDADKDAMSKIVVMNGGNETTLLSFQPLNDIHLRTGFADMSTPNQGEMKYIYLFASLALIVIFMGAFNFTTLSTARSSLRYKEVGVRKATGARRKTLVQQFLSESIVQAFIAVVLAFGFAEIFLPSFNQFVDKDIILSFNIPVILFALFCIFGIGILAGLYPATIMASLNPLIALKGGTKTGKKGALLKTLVCVQFVLAIFLMVCTGIVYKQLNYIQNKDLGLDKKNVLTVWTNLWYNIDRDLKPELLKNPNVLSVSMGAPINNYGEGFEGNNIKWEINGATDSLKMMCIWADKDFAKTYGLDIIAGEFKTGDYWDKATYEGSLVINETAWKQMKVDNPIGVMTSWGRITGIVKDFNFRSLRSKLTPAFIHYNPECLQCVHIKIAPENRAETLKFLKQKYEELGGGRTFDYRYFESQLEENYKAERQQGAIFLAFTIIAICIAMMGVFGLVLLSTQQRTKEIGIRKVNGAHTEDIVRIFCLDYFKWVALAYVIACPLAYLAMDKWLDAFAYRTSMSWWVFVLVGLITLLITILTVGIQTYRVASQDPVKSLRYE